MDGRGGIAPGRQWVEDCDGSVTGEGLEAGTADYGDVDWVCKVDISWEVLGDL